MKTFSFKTTNRSGREFFHMVQQARNGVMITMKDEENRVAAIEDKIYGIAPTPKEIEKSRVDFEAKIKKEVAAGGILEIEDVKVSSGEMQRLYHLRINSLNCMSISKEQAIKYCRHKA